MKVLVACEESQRVCTAFRNRGHEAYSCDILPPSGGHSEWHINSDVTSYINGFCDFYTMDGDVHKIDSPWDILIAHPPCTYLTISGNRWFDISKYGEKARKRILDRKKAADFFMLFVNSNAKRICIENPVGYMNTNYKQPTQIIQPYMFGEPYKKKTCLWLENLPKLIPTNIVSPGISDSNGFVYGSPLLYATDEKGKILAWNDPRTSIARSKTFIGIANAMAEQWG